MVLFERTLIAHISTNHGRITELNCCTADPAFYHIIRILFVIIGADCVHRVNTKVSQKFF